MTTDADAPSSAPTGEQHHLTFGPYAATVTEVGATLRSLTHAGRPLVCGFGVDEPMPLHRGAVLAPWPNRVANGQYTYSGKVLQLPLNEPAQGNAIHGLACFLGWDRHSSTESSVRLGTTIWPQTGYPFQLELHVDYRLAADGLSVRLVATNTGSAAAPYGCSLHPYLIADPDFPMDEWTLHLPADRFLEVGERKLPTDLQPVDGTPYDFRTPTFLRGREVDQALTDITPDPDGRGSATLAAPSGRGVRMSWLARDCAWAQVYTCDRPDPVQNRSGLAIEPMTCPTDAYNSGTDLIHLAPGVSHETTWYLSAF